MKHAHAALEPLDATQSDFCQTQLRSIGTHVETAQKVISNRGPGDRAGQEVDRALTALVHLAAYLNKHRASAKHIQLDPTQLQQYLDAAKQAISARRWPEASECLKLVAQLLVGQPSPATADDGTLANGATDPEPQQKRPMRRRHI